MRLGQRFNNNLLQCLLTFIKRVPEKEGNNVIIIGTTSNEHIVQDLGLWDNFNLKFEVPILSEKKKEISTALNEYLPEKEQEIAKMSLKSEFNLPIKSLNFIAESLDLKYRLEGDINLTQSFFDLYGQIKGVK